MAKKKRDCILCGRLTMMAICQKCQNERDKFQDRPDTFSEQTHRDDDGEESERSSSDEYHGSGRDDY